MNQAPATIHPEIPWRVPRRDYLLLPFIFVMTVIVLLVAGEASARLIYVQDDDAEPCEYLTATGYRYHPLCTSRTKVWEGPWTTQRFNACGYPSAAPCTPLPSGSLRVVVFGSSTSRGALVNFDQSFSSRAAVALSHSCGVTVDFQNLGTEPADVDRIDLRVPEAMALKPSAIVMMIGSFDIMHLKDPPPTGEGEDPPLRFNLHGAVQLLRDSRLFLLMQYELYKDPSFQIRAFLLNGDDADAVRRPLSAAWRQRVADFGDLLGRIRQQTGHVPMLLLYGPGRAPVAMARLAVKPPGVDPLALGAALKQVAEHYDVRFFDTTEALASAADFQSLYYLTDGHLADAGQAVLAGVVERGLLADPAFAACKRISAQ
jgi:hypothetical protein